jgi:hypothetical protein
VLREKRMTRRRRRRRGGGGGAMKHETVTKKLRAKTLKSNSVKV